MRAVLVEAGGQRLWPIVASHNHDYAVAHFVNFYSQNNELLLLAGLDFLTFSAGLAILLNREAAPLPKRLGWYSIVVALVGTAGPLSLLAILFCFPVWIIATGIVIAVKPRRGTLGSAPDDGARSFASATATTVPA